jgi:protein-S-isoprenylcysteine O-methyltransferase Ste14
MYRWVRHPIYSGLLLASTGWSIKTGDRRQLLLSATLFALLRNKSGFEENALRNRFPGYDDYPRSTPRFAPSPRMIGTIFH